MIQLFSPGKKPISPGHVCDTAFLPWKKPISPHSEHSTVLPLTPHTISNRQTCQKEKCMVNRLRYGNFHIIPYINPRHISLRAEDWYGCLKLIWGMIWNLPYNTIIYLSIGTPLQCVKIIIFRHPKNWDISKIAKIFSNFLYQPSTPISLRAEDWFGCLRLIWGMIWNLPYNTVISIYHMALQDSFTLAKILMSCFGLHYFVRFVFCGTSLLAPSGPVVRQITRQELIWVLY